MLTTLPSGTEATSRRMFESLIKSQRMPIDELEAYQQKLLSPLLLHALEHTRFYRNRLTCLFDNPGKIDFGKWSDVEPTCRSHIDQCREDVLSADIPISHGHVHIIQSSGTYGHPVKVPRTVMADVADNAALCRHIETHGIDCSLQLARILPPTMAARRIEDQARQRSWWGLAWSEETSRASWHGQSIFSNLCSQIEWLGSFADPIVLNTYSSNLSRLLLRLQETEKKLTNIRLVIAEGEAISESLRMSCRKLLNCEIVGHVFTAECGLIASQCPSSPNYHINSETCLAEVLREDGRPCTPGETGLLTVTPFYNYAMPVIRYQTGDLATLDDKVCSCGRTLPRLSNRLHRLEEGLKLADGSTFIATHEHCNAMIRYLGSCPWRVIQLATNRFELRFSTTLTDQKIDTLGAESFVRSLVGSGANVTCIEVDIVGRNAGGKFPLTYNQTMPRAS